MQESGRNGEETNEIKNGYSDIEKHWAKNEILAVTGAGIFNGVNQKAFAPNKSLTRVQTAIVLNRLAGKELAGTNSSYKDVSDSSPYANEIAWVTEKEIMKGINASTFAPNQPITREEFAVALYKYLTQNGTTLDSDSEDKYKDDAKISEESKKAVYELQAAGVMSGSNGNFDPNQPITRADAAAIFSKLIQ
ncbi:S-layer homology domain-containing protein [Ureibacillus sp. GCM10028918]|uniref:S-layer homology domain-containing protein n=1 Tax=Ureibacillus sp. GCM10028918 TaxID=3273429 RepID=UPI003610181E